MFGQPTPPGGPGANGRGRDTGALDRLLGDRATAVYSVPPPVIEIESLTKVYRMGDIEVQALRGVSLKIERGELVAIMGPSGSGKSTLMNIIGCLDQPTSGRYLLDGVEVSRLSDDQGAMIRNRKIGFVFQGFNLLPRTSALGNVELPLLYTHGVHVRDTKTPARQALERVGLGERLEHDPSELSGGQQQRVAIARALVTRPAILLADVPTGNLDSRTSVEVMALFQELNDQGITVILVTHEPDIARFCRRVVELRDGRIVRDEPVRDRHDAAADLARLGPLVTAE